MNILAWIYTTFARIYWNIFVGWEIAWLDLLTKMSNVYYYIGVQIVMLWCKCSDILRSMFDILKDFKTDDIKCLNSWDSFISD